MKWGIGGGKWLRYYVIEHGEESAKRRDSSLCLKKEHGCQMCSTERATQGGAVAARNAQSGGWKDEWVRLQSLTMSAAKPTFQVWVQGTQRDFVRSSTICGTLPFPAQLQWTGLHFTSPLQGSWWYLQLDAPLGVTKYIPDPPPWLPNFIWTLMSLAI